MMPTRMPCHVRIAVFFAFAVLNKNTIALRNKKQNTSRKINWQQPREMTLLTHASDHKNTYKCTLYDAFITPARNSASTNVSPPFLFLHSEIFAENVTAAWWFCLYTKTRTHNKNTRLFSLTKRQASCLIINIGEQPREITLLKQSIERIHLRCHDVKDYKKIKIKKIERAHQQNTWYSLGCVIK